jgi:prepilin-type N-terminal cleavage/methylation domain-containing protein
MSHSSRQVAGLTLIELMITLAIFSICLMIAAPSFSSLNQRAALRGAADQTLSLWNLARFEAVKRNQMIKVGIKTGANGAFCLGAATTTDPADTTPCDCLSANPSTNACDVARYPEDQSQWQRVSLVGVTMGGTTLLTAPQPVVIEPRRTSLTEPTDKGTISLAGPAGPNFYKLNLSIDQLGHGVLCESTSAVSKLSDYSKRRCAD